MNILIGTMGKPALINKHNNFSRNPSTICRVIRKIVLVIHVSPLGPK